MKCYACDHILTPQESTRKFKLSGEYTDMCNQCLKTIDDGIETVDSTSIGDDADDEEDQDGDVYSS